MVKPKKIRLKRKKERIIEKDKLDKKASIQKKSLIIALSLCRQISEKFSSTFKSKTFVNYLLLTFIILGGLYFVYGQSPTFTAQASFTNSAFPISSSIKDDIIFSFNNVIGQNSYNSTSNIYVNNQSLIMFNAPLDYNGTDFFDISGYGNNGTVTPPSSINTNVTWENNDCATGGCVQLTGKNLEIAFPDSPQYNFSKIGNFSFDFWYKFNATQWNSFGFIFGKGLHANSPSRVGWGVSISNSTKLFGFGIDNGTVNNNLNVVGAVDNNWHYWYFAYEGNATNYTLKIYKDGTLNVQSSRQQLLSGDITTNRNLTIGQNGNIGVSAGIIDNIHVYNKSFSSQQVLQLYNDGLKNKSFSTLKSQELITNSTYKAQLIVSNYSDIGTYQNTSELLVKDFVPNPIQINFSKAIKDINFYYGASESSNWEEFAGISRPNGALQDNTLILSNHKNISTKIVRTWIRDLQGTETSAVRLIPYQNDSTTIFYNYTNLDRYVQTVLSIGATPYLSFMYAPDNLTNGSLHSSTKSPINDTAYANYILNVTDHYASLYDITGWYISPWNEPDCGSSPSSDFGTFSANQSGINRFVTMFNITYSIVKTAHPEVLIGGPEFCYLNYNSQVYGLQNNNDRLANFLLGAKNIDFISYHEYGTLASPSTSFDHNSSAIINRTTYLYETVANNIWQVAQQYKPNIPIFLSEYNIDSAFSPANPLIRNQFESAWYASALISLLQTNITGEFYFDASNGASSGADLGFGLWTHDITEGTAPTPAYYMKKDFTKYFINGSSIIDTITYQNSNIDSLGIKRLGDNRRFIAVVNRDNQTWSNITINILDSNLQNTILTNKNTTIQYNVINGQVTFPMSPYEVSFYELNSPPSTPIINSPQNDILATHDLDINISGGDDADSDPVYYGIEISGNSSFGPGSLVYAKYNILKTSNASIYGNVANLDNGNYYIRALADDLASNSSYSQTRQFTINVASGGGVSGGGNPDYGNITQQGNQTGNQTINGNIGLTKFSFISIFLFILAIIVAVIIIKWIMAFLRVA